MFLFLYSIQVIQYKKFLRPGTNCIVDTLAQYQRLPRGCLYCSWYHVVVAYVGLKLAMECWHSSHMSSRSHPLIKFEALEKYRSQLVPRRINVVELTVAPTCTLYSIDSAGGLGTWLY